MIDLLQAPVNPSDINSVEGKYPLRAGLPGAVPGHEGVGRVELGKFRLVHLRMLRVILSTSPGLSSS